MTNKTDVSSKFKKFMSDDIMLKIVSLIIAVFLWFIVMNTINPTEVRNYHASIVFENASVLKEQGLTMVNEGDLKIQNNLRVRQQDRLWTSLVKTITKIILQLRWIYLRLSLMMTRLIL
mgnify:CR=1 FL=1